MDKLKLAGALVFFGFGLAPTSGVPQGANTVSCQPPAVQVCFGQETTQVCKCLIFPAPPPT